MEERLPGRAGKVRGRWLCRVGQREEPGKEVRGSEASRGRGRGGRRLRGQGHFRGWAPRK